MSGALSSHNGHRIPSFDVITAGSTANGSLIVGALGIRSGDLAVALGVAEDNTTTPPSDTTPTGVTKHNTGTVVLASTAARASLYSRICDGTENSTTITGFVNQDGDRLWYAFLRPRNCTVESVASLGMDFDFDASGTAPATSSVSLSGLSERFVIGWHGIFGRDTGGFDVTGATGFSCSPGVGSGNIFEQNDSTPNTLAWAALSIWRSGFEPASLSAAIGDVMNDWCFTFAAALEIEIS
jgi:hypothetical protein